MGLHWQDVHVTVVEGFRQIRQDVKIQGELTRDAFREMMSTLGKLLSLLHSYIYSIINVVYQESTSVTPQTPDSIRTQGAWNV